MTTFTAAIRLSCCLGLLCLLTSAKASNLVIETQAGGELEARLGDELLTVEELTVRGPVNAADFLTMKRISISGRLGTIDLAEAMVEGKKIPAYAFAVDREPSIRCPSMLRRVTLPDDVEELGANAFYGASLLEEVALPKSLKRIGNSAFKNCSNLTLPADGIPGGVTEIGDSAFFHCGRLSELCFPQTLKEIGISAFEESGLKQISFPEGCGAQIGDNAFMSCHRLRQAYMPSSVKAFYQQVFFDDYNLETVSQPISYGGSSYAAFKNLSLKEARLSESATAVGPYAFSLCRSLESVELPEGLERIFFMAFQDCRRVDNLILPSTLKEVWYNSLSFPGLKRLYCKAAVPPEYIAGLPDALPFTGQGLYRELDTPKDIPVYVPVGSGELYRNAPGWDYFSNFIETSEFPENTSGLERTEVIEHYAVVTRKAGELAGLLGDDTRLIKSMKIEGPLNASDFETLCDASFFGRLEELDLSGADIEGRKIPDKAFSHSRSNIGAFCPVWLRRIVLPDNIEEIGTSAFSRATFLREVNIPNSLRKIGSSAFSLCESLESPISLPEGIEEIPEQCFANCCKLNEVRLPSSLKTIGESAFSNSGLKFVELPYGLRAIGKEAFCGCRLLKAEIPGSVTELGESAFASNVCLETLRLPEGLKSVPTKLASGCASLKDIVIPTSVKTVMFAAFSNCGSLEAVSLPDRLDNLGERAFGGCARLREVRLPEQCHSLGSRSLSELCGIEKIYSRSATPPECASYNLNGANLGPFDTLDSFKQIITTQYDTPRDIPVYVPRGSAQAYRDAPGWNYFTNFIETDEFPDASVEEAVMPESAVEVSVEQGRILFVGNEGAASDYAVYTVDGRLVASGSADGGTATIDVAPGLYIVALGAKTAKVAVP